MAKCPHCRKEMPTRTNQQSRALHLWLTRKAEQCRDAGISPRKAFEKTMELEMTPEIMKEIFRTVMKAAFKKNSTTELSKLEEIDFVVDHVNRFFAENFYLESMEFPNEPNTIDGKIIGRNFTL